VKIRRQDDGSPVGLGRSPTVWHICVNQTKCFYPFMQL